MLPIYSPQVDSSLARGLVFSREDLAVNQQGHLSETQKRFLQILGNERTRWAGCVTIIWIGIGLFVLSPLPLNTVDMQIKLGIGSVGLVCSGYAAYLILAGLFFRRKIIKDIVEGVTASIEGQVSLSKKANYGKHGVSFKYWLVINGIKFKLQEDAFAQLKNQNAYRLYFTPNTKIILSAEPLKS